MYEIMDSFSMTNTQYIFPAICNWWYWTACSVCTSRTCSL